MDHCAIDDNSDVIILPIDQLTIGMFITAIDRDQNKIKIRNPGQLKYQDAILKLKKSNVIRVWVDVNRSSSSCGLRPRDKSNFLLNPLARKSTITRTSQQIQAKKLLAEAKSLIQKFCRVPMKVKTLTSNNLIILSTT